MALDDRDRNLEKALARHLRSSGASGSLPLSSASAASSCPDAETLAAYHDGSLSTEERNAWKGHVLACEDCQIVLEHLATPVDAPLALDPAASLLVAAQSTRHSAALPMAGAAPATAASVAPAPVSVLSAVRPRRPYFRWLVPAGAIAAGLLTWAVLRESQLPKLTPTVEDHAVQTAENHSTPPPPPTAALTAPAQDAAPKAERVSPAPLAKKQEPDEKLDDLKRDLPEQKDNEKSKITDDISGGSIGGIVQQTPADQRQLRGHLQSSQQVPYGFAAGVVHGPRVAQQQQQSQQNLTAPGGAPANDRKDQPGTDAEAARDRATQAAKAAPASGAAQPEETSSFIADGSVAPPPAKAAAASASPAPSTPASAPAAPQSEPADAGRSRYSTEANGAATQALAVESAAPSANLVRVTSAPIRGPQLFGDPARKSLWRVGPRGSLAFSTDSGASWTSQSSGVAADLFTGSAPAAKVCWVVGANGTILRTIDAGKRWLKLTAPAVADILGIQASDAFHATVWLVPDPKSSALQSYKTSDGGLTWSLVPNE
jgi:hypothetical protein